MQKADSGAKPKRAIYNSSIIDVNAILSGDDTELLPEEEISEDLELPLSIVENFENNLQLV